jgi:TraX protein
MVMGLVAKHNNVLDALKYIALVAMTLDHLKFVLPSAEVPLMMLGRFAFVLFALIVAAHVNRLLISHNISSLRHYALNLFFFAIISEIPHRLMTLNSEAELVTLNVLPTLLLGLLLIVALEARRGDAWKMLVIAVFSLCVVLGLRFSHVELQYGIGGVWFIAAVYRALKHAQDPRLYAAFVVLSFGAAALFPLQPVYLPATFLAIAFGFMVMQLPQESITVRLPRLGKWAYWYYPTHMLAIYGLMCWLGL